MTDIINISYNGNETILSLQSELDATQLLINETTEQTSLSIIQNIQSDKISISDVGQAGDVVVVEKQVEEPTIIIGKIEIENTLVDLDKMTNSAFTVTRKTFESGQFGTKKIHVLSNETTLFERTIEYDGNGRVSVITTDDMTGSGRLVKTISYDINGSIDNIKREITTWR